MIAMPGQAPAGSVLYVTVRPDPMMTGIAPHEEILAGPFADQDEALSAVRVVRSWLQSADPWTANSPMGVLRLGPAAQAEVGPITPRFRRESPTEIADHGTRISAKVIRRLATERRESLTGEVAAGFGAAE
jgi:hypothetical protein